MDYLPHQRLLATILCIKRICFQLYHIPNTIACIEGFHIFRSEKNISKIFYILFMLLVMQFNLQKFLNIFDIYISVTRYSLYLYFMFMLLVTRYISIFFFCYSLLIMFLFYFYVIVEFLLKQQARIVKFSFKSYFLFLLCSFEVSLKPFLVG